ncbi:MAG: secE [Gammaproteobacteria bacterium]|nr:secE [Gammaproteobacteria bacterium]
MVLKVIEGQRNITSDWIKWLIVIFLLVSGVVANYYYSYQPWPLRLLGWLFLLGIATVVALQTSQGKHALHFARESRAELRKVVWPTYQETVQTTLFVAAMVLVLGLILWGVDSILMWLIGWLTGQRG